MKDLHKNTEIAKAKNFLYNNKGYLKKSPYKLSERLNIEFNEAYIALKEVKKEIKYSLNNFISEGNFQNSILEQKICSYMIKDVKEKCGVTVNDSLRDYDSYIKELSSVKEVIKPKILIYDLEVSYNIVKSWRVGYNLNINPADIIEERKIICVSYKWLGEDQTYNIQWDKDHDDKFLLEQFIPVLNEADLIVAHNGDRFDLKWIKTRAIYHDLPMLLNYPQFDTLKVAKKKFNFNSNKLDYISEFLGFENKIKTNMKLWDDIIFKSCPIAMDDMIKYCNMDVELLEKVYNKLVYWETPKYHINAENKTSSPISGGYNLELVKTVTSNQGTIKRIMKDLDNGRLFEMSNTNYLKYKENK